MTGRLTVRIAGESGQGINSVGEAVTTSFKASELYTFSYREYPSLIKGGHAFQQIEVSSSPVSAPSSHCDLLVCLSRVSFHVYYADVRTGGVIVHSIFRLDLKKEEEAFLKDHKITVHYVDAEQLAEDSGGKRLMSNTVLVGAIWKMFELPLQPVEDVVRGVFKKKPQYIDVNIACLRAGYEQQLETPELLRIRAPQNSAIANSILLTGNHALALGAVTAGVRAYYAYPMTPSSSILSYLASVQHDTGMVVKQVDDEIAAAQMAMGSMFMGTRALTATSGGGFDLMTESLSLAGMTETPFVCVIGQRPGPATGLPTWTATSDLFLAVFAGHGEFPRVVMAASDPESAYTLIQDAMNFAEVYQIPVLLLTEKQIAESLFQLEKLPNAVPIHRGITENTDTLTPSDRYKITPTGISPRWIPGHANATYVANSDEHVPDGSLTEDAIPTKQMYDKRLRKMLSIYDVLPEPTLYGPESAPITFVGWGSVKRSLLDALDVLKANGKHTAFNYLHFDYILPLKTERFMQLTNTSQRMVLIENNALGQLGALIAQETGYLFKNSFLKYDGRPFFVDDILNFVEGKQ